MDNQLIAKRIKQARDIKGYTLEDIASEIGVAKSTIQRYENGLISKPKLPVLHSMANSLNVNPAWLSGYDVPMEANTSMKEIVSLINIVRNDKDVIEFLDIYYNKLSQDNQKRIIDMARALSDH